jgi:hypothetical protein
VSLSPEIFGNLSGINEISARLALPNRSASQDILARTPKLEKGRFAGRVMGIGIDA